MTASKTPNEAPTFIDFIEVRAGKRNGIFHEGEVRGELVYMPLTPSSARYIADALEAAADAIEAHQAGQAPPRH
jgi:hypothetical protein